MERRQFLQGLAAATVTGTVISPGRTTASPRRLSASSTDWNVKFRTEIEDISPTKTGFSVMTQSDRLFLVGDGVAAYDVTTGSTQWTRADLRNRVSGSAVTEDALVVYLGEQARVRTLSLSTGEERWNQSLADISTTVTQPVDLPGTIHSPRPVIYKSLALVPANETLLAFHLDDGSLKWERTHDTELTGVVVDGDEVYVTGRSGTVARTDPTDGTATWDVELPDIDRTLYGPTVADDAVLVGSRGGVYAVERTGELRWQYHNDTYPGPLGSLAAAGGHCFIRRQQTEKHEFISAQDGTRKLTNIVGLDMADGTERWTHDLIPEAVSDRGTATDHPPLSPVVRDETVWATGTRGIVALGPDSGTLRRRWQLPEAVQSTPVIHGGSIYFVGAGAIYALDRTGDCKPPTVSDITATYEPMPPEPEILQFQGAWTGDSNCRQLGLVEVWLDDWLAGIFSEYIPAGEQTAFTANWRVELPNEMDTTTVKSRGTAGTLIEEHTVPIADYRDEPAEFEIMCTEIDTEAIEPGEAVNIRLNVRNYGYEGGYVATLERDGTVIKERTGSIGKFTEDNVNPCHDGTDIRFAPTFDQKGEYTLRVTISPSKDEGSSDSTVVGTLVVSDSPTETSGSTDTEQTPETADSGDTEQTDENGSGFGISVGVASLISSSYLLSRRLRQSRE